MTSLAGTWRITVMDRWDQDDVDLVGPAFIEFDKRGQGQFQFIAVEGGMDYVHGERNGLPCVEFTWIGHDDGEPTSGRGWARLEKDGSLSGHIYFHLGEDSGFKAILFKKGRPAAKAAAKRKSR